MATMSTYWLLWGIYLAASAVFFIVFWRLTRFSSARLLSYMVRAFTIAVVFTPWYANQQGVVLAPAIMVVALDAITIGGSAAARGMVPLSLAIVLALIIAFVYYLVNRKKPRKHNRKQYSK